MLRLNMSRNFWVLFGFFGLSIAQQYIPGEPGAPWTDEEVLIVKSKLWFVMEGTAAKMAMNQVYQTDSLSVCNWNRMPGAPKFLRLGFHDCLKYTDGTGGCDGCLNWEGVGYDFDLNNPPFPNVGATNNNGLECTVDLLESIYTNATFPYGYAPSLNLSLRDSGKSRADLWALASIVAVEYASQTNDEVCDGTYNKNHGPQCLEDIGGPDCKVNLPRMKFQTGRKDCTEFGDKPFKALKHESHPNAVGNGQMTADFFAKDFGFNGREMVAIMGGHTIGRLHYSVSLFRYLWTTKEENLFNNHYYKSITREDRYAFEDNDCHIVTDAEGNKPKTRWLAHVRGDTHNFGPVHWIHENYGCPKCWHDKHKNDTCCMNVPEGQYCQADSVDISTDKSVNGGCEKFRFISGLDEMALPCEMGMYFDFKVTPDGIPYGCPGFELFNQTYWKGYPWKFLWSLMPKKENATIWEYERADPNCGFTKIEIPSGSKPMYQIFEEYAKDQNVWIKDYAGAHEKMLSNGYNDLIDGPDQYTGIKCRRSSLWDSQEYSECFRESIFTSGPKFALVSRLDGRALQGKNTGPSYYGEAEMWTFNISDPKQLWVKSTLGDQLLNVATGKPLHAGTKGRSWAEDQSLRFLNPRRPGRTLTRDWKQADGVGVWQAPISDESRMQWITVPSDQLSLVSDPLNQIFIKSKLDERVLAGKKTNGEAIMKTLDPKDDIHKWVMMRNPTKGIQLVNVKTLLPLTVGSINYWNLTSPENDFLQILSVSDSTLGLKRELNQWDGVHVSIGSIGNGDETKFSFVPVVASLE